MKNSINILFSVSLVLVTMADLFGQDPNIDSLARKYAIEATLTGGSSSANQSAAIKAAKARMANHNNSKNRKGKKNAYKFISPPKLNIGVNLLLAQAAISTSLGLTLENGIAMLGDQVVGQHDWYAAEYGVRNTLSMDNDMETVWYTEGAPESYGWGSFSTKSTAIFGATVDFRIEKESALGAKAGYFFSLGAIGMRNPLVQMMGEKQDLIYFPVGIGYIIPGNPKFWLEIGGNTLLSKEGIQGYKFDFAMVFGNLKLGPSLNIINTRSDASIEYNASTVGIQLGFIP